MTFISYAQNFEDVILHRALKDIKNGVYIDVGANDPVADSVTKAFYDAGWRGINIEPVSEWFEKLEQDRPEDINLQVAAGSHQGSASFYEVLGTGLSTMDKSIAENHASTHGFGIKEYDVPVVTLTSICEQYTPADIHFLKIDVEGFEQEVLQGLNLKLIRPWIIVAESTLPLTQNEKYMDWDGYLLMADYEFCYFDGLNRFYVAKEHQEIKKKLAVPPNIFDEFHMSGEGTGIVHKQFAMLKEALTESKARNQLVELTLGESEQSNQDLTLQLQELQLAHAKNEGLLRQYELNKSELLLSLLEKETQQQESNRLISLSRTDIQELKKALTESKARNQLVESTLGESEQTNQDLKLQLSGLQADLIKQEAIACTLHQASNDWWLLADQNSQALKEAKITIAKLSQASNDWWSLADQNSRALEEATSTIAGLDLTSNTWRLEAEDLSKQLQSVYNSKSWTITWPLRITSYFLQFLLFLPIMLLKYMIGLPKRIVRWLLVRSIHIVLKYPKCQKVFGSWLKSYPLIYNKLRELAVSRGLIGVQDSIGGIAPFYQGDSPPVIEMVLASEKVTNSDIGFSYLAPSSRRVYNELKAVAQTKNDL